MLTYDTITMSRTLLLSYCNVDCRCRFPLPTVDTKYATSKWLNNNGKPLCSTGEVSRAPRFLSHQQPIIDISFENQIIKTDYNRG